MIKNEIIFVRLRASEGFVRSFYANRHSMKNILNEILVFHVILIYRWIKKNDFNSIYTSESPVFYNPPNTHLAKSGKVHVNKYHKPLRWSCEISNQFIVL